MRSEAINNYIDKGIIQCDIDLDIPPEDKVEWALHLRKNVELEYIGDSDSDEMRADPKNYRYFYRHKNIKDYLFE